MSEELQIQLISEKDRPAEIDFDKEIYELTQQIDMLSSRRFP